MNMTRHANKRAAQRAIVTSELDILLGIGAFFPQKGGTALVMVSQAETQRWVEATKRALEMLNVSNEKNQSHLKKVKKILKRLAKHLTSNAPPYLILNEESEKVITCGHSYKQKLSRT
jgi:hypothetical protein